MNSSSPSKAGCCRTNFLNAETQASVIGRGLVRFHGAIGATVARHPTIFLLSGLLIVAGFGVALMNLHVEFDQVSQWKIRGDKWDQYQQKFEGTFGPFFMSVQLPSQARNSLTSLSATPRHSELYTLLNPNASDPTTADDVVRKDVLLELLELEAKIDAIRITNPNNSNDVRGLDQLCLKPDPSTVCYKLSPLWHWHYNAQEIIDDPVIRSTLGRKGFSMPLGLRVTPATVLVGYEDLYSRINYAHGFKTMILFLNDPTSMAMAKLFNKELEALVHAWSANSTLVSVLFQHDESIAEAVSTALEADLVVIVAGFMVIFVFVCLSLGNTYALCCGSKETRNARIVKSKIGLGIGGIVLLGCVFMVTEAIATLAGLVLSPITLQVLPVLLLGVGIDGVYVLTRSFSAHYNPRSRGVEEAIPQAMRKTMEHAGTSFLMSALATTLIFLPVLSIGVPVITSLSLQAIIAVWVNYLTQLFLFSAAVVFDARRMIGHRADILCCCVKLEVENDGDIFVSSANSHAGTTAQDSTDSGDAILGSDSNESDSGDAKEYTSTAKASKPAQSRLRSCLTLMLSHRVPRIITYVFFAVLVGISVAGCVHVTPGLDINGLIPENSDAGHINNLSSSSTSFPFFFTLGKHDYADPAVGAALMTYKQRLDDSHILDGPVTLWYSDFVSWLAFLSPYSAEFRANNDVIPRDKFYPWLREFIGSIAAAHKIFMRFDESGAIVASAMLGTTPRLPGLLDVLNASLAIEDLMHKAAEISPILTTPTDPNSKDPNMAEYSPVFFALGQFDHFTAKAALSTGLSLLFSFLVMFLFTQNVVVALLALVALSVLTLAIVASHIVLGLEANAISIVNVALSICLGSEYFCFFIQAYFGQERRAGSQQRRVANALMFIGSMLLLSVISALLGMAVLLATSYKVIRIYFGGMWLIVIFISSLCSLWLAPLMLSDLGLAFPSLFKGSSPPIERHPDTLTSSSSE